MNTHANAARSVNRTARAGLRDALLEAGPACGPQDAELFTGPDVAESESVRAEREATAARICAGCPASAECLAYALAIRPRAGVWAGRSVADIRALAISQQSATTAPDREVA